MKTSPPNELETGYFVKAEALENYKDEEKVYDKDEQGHKKLRLFPKGTFIYRLAEVSLWLNAIHAGKQVP